MFGLEKWPLVFVLWISFIDTVVPTCPDLWEPDNSILIESGFTTGSTASYSCEAGYVLDGVSERTCQDNGTWSYSEPSCIAVPPPCETNYSDGRCFWKNDAYLSWKDALTSCENQGGTLAVLDSEEILDFVLENLPEVDNDKRHIGLTDGHTEAIYRWMDTSVVSFGQWEKIEEGTDKNCVLMDNGGDWISDQCSKDIRSICMASEHGPPECDTLEKGCLGVTNDSWTCTTDQCGVGFHVEYHNVSDISECKMKCQLRTDINCRAVNYILGTSTCKLMTSIDYSPCSVQNLFCSRTAIARDVNDICYIPVEMTKNFVEAASYCHDISGVQGQLASVMSEEEHDAIFPLIANSIYMIGLVMTDHQTSWQWANGTFPEWVKWADADPKFSTYQQCVKYNYGKWHDAECGVKIKFICETTLSSTCESFPYIANTSRSIDYGTKLVTYTCTSPNISFSDGNSTKVIPCECEMDVTVIEDELGSCFDVDCGRPEFDEDAILVAYNSTGHLAEVNYQLNCTEGYYVEGNTSRTCLTTRQWSGVTPHCAPISCGELPHPPNGTVSFDDVVLNSVAQYVCEVGYAVTGDETRRCQASGNWSGEEPTCEVSIHPCETVYYKDFCFWLTTGSLDWAANQKQCELGQGALAIIRNQDMHNFLTTNLTGLLDSDTYIGLSDGHTEGIFRWIDTQAAEWVNWDASEDSSSGTSNCVYVRSSHGTWVQTNCDTNMRALCCGWKGRKQKCNQLKEGCLGVREDTWVCDPGSCFRDIYDVMYNNVVDLFECQNMCQLRIDFNCREIEFFDGDCKMRVEESNALFTDNCGDSTYCRRTTHFRDLTDVCVTKVTETAEPQVAQDLCEEKGKTLISVRSQEEHDYFHQTYFNSGFDKFWIGLSQTSENPEGMWSWPDETFPEWSVWKGDYPRFTTGKNCVKYDYELWRNVYCTDKRYYACENSRLEKCLNLPDIAHTDGSLDTSNFLYTYTCEACHAFPDGSENKTIICDCNLDPDTIPTTISPCELKTGCLTTTSQASTLEDELTTVESTETQSDTSSALPPSTGLSTEYLTTGTEYLTTSTEYLTTSTEYLTTSTEYLSTSTEYLTTSTEYLTTSTEYTTTNEGIEVITSTSSTTSTSSKTTTTTASSHVPSIHQIPMCTKPAVVANADMIESVTLIGGYAIYRCHPFYHFENGGTVRTIWCLQPGRWSTTVPGCVASTCEDIDDNIKARISTNVTSVGTSVTLTCGSGSLFDTGLGRVEIVCTESGQWSQSITECTDRCGAIPLVENAELVASYSNKLGENATLRCYRGYRFSDGTSEKDITCSGGTWSYPGNCIVDVCPSLEPHTPEVKLSTTLAVFSTLVEVSCPAGWTFTPGQQHKQLECEELGLWNDTVPECIEVRCPPLETITNAVQSGNGTLFGELVTYMCNHDDVLPYRHLDGYTTKTIECQQSGQWTENELSCEKERCEPLPLLENAIPDSTNATWGSLVVYHCHHGYQFEDGQTNVIAFCLSKWNISSAYSCTRVSCSPVDSSFPVLEATPSGGRYGDTTLVTCIEGYTIGGNESASLLCAQDKQWHLNDQEFSIYSGCQAISCGKPPNVDNALLSDTGNYSYQATQVLRCRHGYWFTRDTTSLTIECDSSQSWSPTVDSCQAVTCPAVGSWSGHVTNTSSWQYRQHVNVSCTPGFRMSDNASHRVYYCTEFGSWDKNIVPCKAITEAPAFSPSPEEAPAAGTIAAVGGLMVTIALVIILVVDIPSFALAFVSLKRTVYRCKGYVYTTNSGEFKSLDMQ